MVRLTYDKNDKAVSKKRDDMYIILIIYIYIYLYFYLICFYFSYYILIVHYIGLMLFRALRSLVILYI